MDSKSFDPVIIPGFSSQRVAASIARHMGAEFVPVTYDIFNNEEIKPTLPKEVNLRGADVIVVAGGSGSPNNIIFETQQLQAIARNGFARSVTTYVPYLSYGRQDSNFDERAPIGLTTALRGYFANTDRAVICDPHNASGTALFLEGMGKAYQFVHFANPFARQLDYLRDWGILDPENCVVMGLDHGGVKRMSKGFLNAVRTLTGIDMPGKGTDLPYLDKERDRTTGETEFHGIKNIDPEGIRGKDILLFEDMIDSGGSAIKGAQFLKKSGVRSVTVLGSIDIFSAPRVGRMLSISGLDGETLQIPVSDKNPDPALAIKKINASAKDGAGIDLILTSNAMDHVLTDPVLAQAVDASPVIHKVDTTCFQADILTAMGSTDRKTNSVAHRLSGMPDYVEGVPFTPTPLKPGNNLLALAR